MMREKKLTFFMDNFLTGEIFCKATITLYPGKEEIQSFYFHAV